MLNWNDIKKQNDYSGKKPNLPTPKATAPKNVPSLQIPGANTVSPWVKSPTAKLPMVNAPITPAPNTKAFKESERKNIFQNKVQENWLGKNVSAGLSSFNTSLAKTLDWILPTEIAGRYDIIDPIFNAYKKADEGYQARATDVNDSQTKQIAGTLVSGTVQALPSAIMAVMTGGGSIAGQATTQGLASASALPNLGKVSKVTKIMEDAVQELGSNPMFWNSFAQMAGPTYEKELANGASETKASASAMLNGILGSAIEVSGGLETFKWADKGWKQFIRQALEEGGEEVTQYTVENIINKAVGSNDAKWLSMDKEQDAVINPKAQAEQGAYGVAIGGILGGGQRGLVKGLNAVSKPKSKVLEQKIAEAKKPVETAKHEPTEAPHTDFYAGRGAISPDIDKADQLALPEPKYVDKPGVDKVKSKNDTFKSIVAKINTEDKADRAEIAEIVKTIDRDDWDTNETFDKIVNLVSKQKYADYNPEESYPGLKKDIRETAIQITGDIRQITDFNSLRKKAMGKVKLSKNGKPMDVLYAEWSDMYPDLFPETITHPTEQLEQVIKVSDSLKSTVKTVGDMLSYNEILEGPVTDIYGEILNYRNAVKVVQDQAYQNAKGQREVPKTLVKSELAGNVKAKPLPEVSEKASNQAVEPRKEEPRPIPQPKEVKPLETLVKKEAKDADRERVNIPEERVDRRTAEKLGKLNKFITEEMGRPGGFTISRSKEGSRVKEIARLFGKEAYIVSPTEEGASIFNGVNIGGDIYINDDTINPLHVVFGHEFAHDLRVDHPEGFKKFAEIFAEELDQTKYAKYAKDMQSVSKDTNQEYDYDYILEEMIAEFSGEMFNKPEIMARVFEADRGLAKAIHDIIVKILQTVQKTIGRNYIVTDGINDLKRVEDAYVQLVKEARLKDARPDKPGMKLSAKKEAAEDLGWHTDGDRVVLTNKNAFSTEQWEKIAKSFRKIGYTDLRDGRHTKEAFSRFIGKNGHKFNEDQSEVLIKMLDDKKPKAVPLEETAEAVKIKNRTKAIRKFGTTEKLSEAGYITTNGKMLDFSGKKFGGQPNQRSMDHREINDILGNTGDGYSDGMYQFIDEGNIRLQMYGFETAGIPTKQQEAVLRNLIYKNDGEVYVDLGLPGKHNTNPVSVEYPTGTRPEKIFNDIKKYYNDGVEPYVSDVSKFRFSAKRDSDGKLLTKEQAAFFKDSKVRDADGNLLKVYHGTNTDFTEFKHKYIGSSTGRRDNAAGFYFSSEKNGVLDGGASWYGDKIVEVYLNIKNPLILTNTSSMDLLKIVAGIAPNKEIEGHSVNDILNVYNELMNQKWYVSDGRLNNKEVDVEYEDKIYTYRSLRGELEEQKEGIARYFVSLILDITIPVRLSEYHIDDIIYKKYDGVINDSEYVAFYSNQIKSVDNLNPTTDPDIRFSMKRDKEALNKLALDDMMDGYKSREEVVENAQKLIDQIREWESQISMFDGQLSFEELGWGKNSKIQGEVERPKDSKGYSKVKTVGLSISKEFIEKGEIDLRGRKVDSPKELALIAQVYRHPGFETNRFFYLKNGVVVGHEGVTSKLPGMTRIVPIDVTGKDNLTIQIETEAWVEEIKERMRKLGADELYMLHNHPSGNPNPSRADKQSTTTMQKIFGNKFAGSVVIDSDKYGFVSPYGSVKIGELNLGKDKLLTPSVEHPLNNARITDTGQLAELAKELEVSDDVTTLIFVDAEAKIRSIQEVKNNFFYNLKSIKAHIEEAYPEYGVYKTMAVAVYKGKEAHIKKLINGGYLMDAYDPVNNEFYSAEYGVRSKEIPSGLNQKVGYSVDQKYDIYDTKLSMKRGMESPIYRDRMEMELAENGEYQEIIKELEGVLYTDDPEIQYLAKHIKDRKGWVLGLKDIYRNMRDAFGDGYQHIKINYLDPFDQSKKDYVDTIKKYTDIVYYDVVKGLGIKKGSRYSKAVQWIGEGQRQMGMKEIKDPITGKTYKVTNLIPYTMEDLKKDFPTKWQDIKKASEIMRTVYDDMIDEVNESRRKIYPNNPSKLVPKRKDYFRHYREISSTFEGLWNVFSSSTNIDPKLAGISEFTKPKSRWASFMQERGMGKYKEDAIGGFLDYVGPASYSIHIDPHISRFRGLAKQIAEATGDTKNANDTIAYLHDFANSLAGKTVDWDRFFSKQFGRKPLIVLATLNNRVKKNQILMNLRSALSQVANVPLGIAKIKNPKHLIPGAGDAITYMIGANKSVAERYSHSQFISERYSHQMLDRFKSSLLDKPELMASWLIESADQMGTMFIWNSAYRSAVDKQVMNPTKYADDVTRALVAGRGIGEVPLWQQSKVFQMIAPFQLEVTNLWHIFGDMKKDRDIGGLWLILLFNWLFNNAYEEAVGDRIVFDPIDAIASSLREGNELFSAETGGRLAGEVLSNLPLGQTLATLVPEYDMEITIPGTEKELYTLPSRKKLFGDNDPTRYGSGILLAKAMQDPIYKLLPPLGGSQLKKTIEGATALKKGEVSKKDEIKFLVEKKPENIVKGLAFGQYAFDEAGDYYDKGRRKLTEKQSTEIRKSKDPQTAYETLMVKRRMESVDRKIKDLLKDEELSEKERNQAITKELRKKIQEIKTTSIYTDTEKASMVLKIQGEILKYK